MGTKKTSTIWGGRFEKSPAKGLSDINSCVDVDMRMATQDIAASKAHCQMLAAQGIISKNDSKAILGGLDKISNEINRGDFVFLQELEDIHMNVEARLAALIGDAAGRLHTARSRNDQVATDFRLWVRGAIGGLIEKIEILQGVLGDICKSHEKTTMPGFTHLQSAQPVTLAIHMDAYIKMLSRDAGRLSDCAARLNESPLGCAALAGTPFNIDRDATAKALGFAAPMENTMDGVSARDFANEFLFDCAQCGLHLSRLAEEVILWATPQFGFINLSDDWSTGSSIMPQKKNPDGAELVRGKSGRLIGNLVTLLSVMKSLPLAYNKDMQEDKEPVFDSNDTLCLALDAMSGMLKGAEFNKDAMANAARAGHSNATALADWLVMKLDLPFRRAHHITGAMVAMANERVCALEDLPLEAMQQLEPRITKAVYKVL